MKLDVNGQSYNLASAGTANTALGLGIAGTALGLMGNRGCGNNGGLLGGLFGGNCGCNDCYVTEREQNLAIALAQAQSKDIAQSFAREEDAKIFNEARRSDDKIAAVLERTNAGLIEIGNGVSRLDVKTACLEEKLNWIREESARNLAEAKSYTDHRVDCEAAARQAADQNILAYTNGELAKKISGELVIGGDQIRYGGCSPVLCNTNCLGTKSNPVFLNSTTTDVEAITTAVLNAIRASQPAQ